MFLIRQNKTNLLASIIPQIKAYITPIKLAYVDYKPPPIESKEWEIWKDALEGNYVSEQEFIEGNIKIKLPMIDFLKFEAKWIKGEGKQ